MTILEFDLYGPELLFEEFASVMASGASGVVIGSQSGHRPAWLTVEQHPALAGTSVDELLHLPFLQPDRVPDLLHAYLIAKRGNSLRVMAEEVRWGKRGPRVITPLAQR